MGQLEENRGTRALSVHGASVPFHSSTAPRAREQSRRAVIHRLIAALLLAGMQAWDAYRLYFGWDDDEWKRDVVPIRRQMATLAIWLQSMDEQGNI